MTVKHRHHRRVLSLSLSLSLSLLLLIPWVLAPAFREILNRHLLIRREDI
jgi:hypothetical protein